MSHWSQNPGNGNLSEVADFGATQTRRMSSADGVLSRLSDIATSEAATSWQSGSSTAWQERIARVHPMLDAATQVALLWRGAAGTYHDAVAWIQAQEATAHHLIDTANHTLVAYQNVPGEVAGNPTVQAKLHQCETDINHGYATLYSLGNQRSQVDRDFAQMLNVRGVLDEHRDWTALAGLYGDAKSVEDILTTRKALADEYAALGDKAIKSTASSDEIAELAKFLAASASDPGLATEFWSRYTGAEATSMFGQGVADQLATGDPNGDTDVSAAAAVAFAQGLRASLAAASVTWDEETAQRFADQMWTGPGNPPAAGQVTGERAEIGYLFDDADGSPMSKYFTVAMADRIDAFERGVDDFDNPNNRFLAWDQDTIAAANGHTADMDALWAAEGKGDPGASTVRIEDPLSRVLDTLGVYPDAAWDWLSSTDSVLADGATTTAQDRVDFYSQRDWTTDGWDGFGSLWEGSMQADGGLASHTYDAATWNDQCDVASRVIVGLDGAGLIGVGTISDGGAANLGTAIGHLMPFADFQTFTDVAAPKAGGQFVTGPYPLPGVEGNRVMPYVVTDAFGDLLSTVVSKDTGFVPVTTAVNQLENQLIIEANGKGGFELWNTALSRVSNLDGMLEGAVGGADILQARLDDGAIRNQMQVAQFALNFLPGAGAPAVAGKLVDIGIGTAAGAGYDSLTDYLASNERLADSLLAPTEGAGAAALRSKIDLMLRETDVFTLHAVVPDMGQEIWYGTFTAAHDKTFYSALWKETNDV